MSFEGDQYKGTLWGTIITHCRQNSRISMEFCILPRTRHEGFDGLIQITPNKTVRFWLDSTYYCKEDSMSLIIFYILHTIANKTVGFWLDSTYYRKQDSRILMGFYILPETKRQDFDGILHITKDKIAVFWYGAAYYLRQDSRILMGFYILPQRKQ